MKRNQKMRWLRTGAAALLAALLCVMPIAASVAADELQEGQTVETAAEQEVSGDEDLQAAEPAGEAGEAQSDEEADPADAGAAADPAQEGDEADPAAPEAGSAGEEAVAADAEEAETNDADAAEAGPEPEAAAEEELFGNAENPSFEVTFSPVINTTTTTLTLSDPEGVEAVADSVKVTAVMRYEGTATRTVEKTVALAEFTSGSTTLDFGDYGKWYVTVSFLKEGAAVQINDEVVTGIIAEEYNIAPISATLPVTFFSLNLWGTMYGDGSTPNIREQGPTILVMERPNSYDWNALPEGLYPLPYMSVEDLTYQPGGNIDAMNLFREREWIMAAYVRDLLEVDPDAMIHLYCVDYYSDLVQKIIYANRIPEDQYTITLLSDGSFTYARFAQVYNDENPEAKHEQLKAKWEAAKEYAYDNGEVQEGFEAGKCGDYLWVVTDTEPNAELWVARSALFESPGDGDAFAITLKGKKDSGGNVIVPKNPKIIDISISTLLTKNIQNPGNTEEFKALYNFNDGFFSEAEEQGKDAMVFLGSRVTSEPDFENYCRFVMTYYKDDYIYYYKGHPATPTDLYPQKQEQLAGLGITDVDSSIAAELILFFNPEIYLSGYASSTYASVPVGMGKGMFNMTKEAGLANLNYMNMEFWTTPITDDSDDRLLDLREIGHESYLVEFNDTVAEEKGYDIAIWDATKPEIRYYKELEDGSYELVGSEAGVAASRAVQPGVYAIGTALKSTMVLEVAGGSTADKANVQIYTYNKSKAQQWEISYDENEYATIKNVKSGLVLEVASGSTKSGANVRQYKSNNTLAQKWILTKNSDGTIKIASAKNPGIVLNVQDAKTANKTNVQVYTDNGKKSQKFRFYPVNPEVSSEGQTEIEDGYYRIASAAKTDLVLDAANRDQANGVNLQVGTEAFTETQIFKIEKTESGYYRITNAWNGRALDVDKGSIIPGTNVQMWKSTTANSEWAIYRVSGGAYVFRNVASGLVLDLKGGKKIPGTNVDVYTANGSSAQRWLLHAEQDPKEYLDEIANTYRDALPNGYYTISPSAGTATVFEVKGGSTSNKANVQLYKNVRSSARMWKVTHDENGYITIKNLKSGLVLDIAGGAKKVGANVQQYKSNDSRAQKWIAIPQDDGSFLLASAVSPDLVIDIKGGKAVSGSNIQVYKWNDSAAQKFRFDEL